MALRRYWVEARSGRSRSRGSAEFLRARKPFRSTSRPGSHRLAEICARFSRAARANAYSALEQARIDTKTAARILDDVRQVLRGASRVAAAPGVAAGLESLKVDPAIARSPSPSYTYLSLQEAQQEAALAQARARAEALEGVVNEADALRKLVGQALQVQVLAPPAEPLFPVSPAHCARPCSRASRLRRSEPWPC